MKTRRKEVEKIPLHIACMHPAMEVIEGALLRRGDSAAVAHGRAIALIDLLIRGGHIKRTPEQVTAQREYRRSIPRGKVRVSDIVKVDVQLYPVRRPQ